MYFPHSWRVDTVLVLHYISIGLTLLYIHFSCGGVSTRAESAACAFERDVLCAEQRLPRRAQLGGHFCTLGDAVLCGPAYLCSAGFTGPVSYLCGRTALGNV